MKAKTMFYCTQCGNETPRWSGQCQSCGAWNTIEEAPSVKPDKNGKSFSNSLRKADKPKLLKDINDLDEVRFSTGISELDRVLGGGAVVGSLVLIGGAPGIGKSTLLLQICGNITDRKILYVSGEESQHQLKMRADRLGVSASNLFIMSETDIDVIISEANEMSPDILIIDSIQTVYNSEVTSTPGSIAQVKECTMSIMHLAKSKNLTAFIIGHVNKEGAIAGPKVLEHMVDCVLYFNGDNVRNYRILRAAKNRFGSTNEIGIFEMTSKGLKDVPNPADLLLSGRPVNAPGTCIACIMEGSRPILAEVQALFSNTANNIPRKNTNGVDYNRIAMLLAVMEKRGGLHISGLESFFNVVGGLEIDEPAADLAFILAAASSFRDKPIGDDFLAIGEVGLTGEIRNVLSLEQRLSEAARIGFKRCAIPADANNINIPAGMQILRVHNIREAINAIVI